VVSERASTTGHWVPLLHDDPNPCPTHAVKVR
jgi:hypothetical protein